MVRFLIIFLVFVSVAFAAGDIPDPATLPEEVPHGDSPATHPAEAARRLLAGKALLEKGELEQAQEEFAKAYEADDLQPLTYFYRAVVAYRLGDYPRALEHAKTGSGVVTDIFAYGTPTAETEAQAARFKELQDAIQTKLAATGGKAGENPVKKKAEFDAALLEGDEAYAKGLAAKAAAAYARAYRADPTQGEIGLRAATLYADRLKNPFEAALLWQQVLAAGEPHATTARAELQSHREAIDAVLREGLARREQWRRSGDPTEALRYAAAFPESTELQVELALLFARKGKVDEFITHLQAASRLGLTGDEFLAQTEFINHLEKSGGLGSAGGQRLSAFVRDAYGAETLTALSTELQRRADETARLAREKAAKAQQAKLAAERKELSARRDGKRLTVMREVNTILSRLNGTEVETIDAQPPKYSAKGRHLMFRNNTLNYDGSAYVLSSDVLHRSIRKNGNTSENSQVNNYTLRSFAAYRTTEAKPSNWIDFNPDSTFQVLGPHRALCKQLNIQFNEGVVLEQSATRDVNGDVSNGMEFRNSFNISIYVMLAETDIPRLQQLFAQLAQLDQAGADVEKLRQLKL